MQTQQVIKAAGDATAYGTVIATLVGWLPSVAALFSILWLTIQITEKIADKKFHELLQSAYKKFSEATRGVWAKLRN